VASIIDLPDDLISALGQHLNSPIHTARYTGGGDINDARTLTTEAGNFYFLKYNGLPQAPHMFVAEEVGLLQLSRAGARTPEVLARGVSAQGTAFLLMEYVEDTPAEPVAWDQLGYMLAEIHQTTRFSFGLEQDTYIGPLLQSNTDRTDWITFFWENRIFPQVELATEKGLVEPSLRTRFDLLFDLLPNLFGPQEPPTLVHGDLWSGNFLIAPNQQPVLIDPAVAFAHREMDLGMSRLFGGFHWRFYRAYQEAFPLHPGWEDRLPLFQLYYLLVHVNLFGRSYLGSVKNILNQYTA
jgi:protein-ribulosamine 3-kinase